jgi:hypothetical protein
MSVLVLDKRLGGGLLAACVMYLESMLFRLYSWVSVFGPGEDVLCYAQRHGG